MKLMSTAAAAVTLLCMTSSVNAQGSASSASSFDGSSSWSGYVETVNRTDVPVGAKTYFTGLSTFEKGPNKCSGVLITPKHVLTTSGCMTRDVRWAAVGAQSYNRTYDGEKIKVKAMLTHSNSTTWSNDFMVLELEKPSSVAPVALAAADDSDNQPGQWGEYIGWKYTQETETSPPKLEDRLQSAKVKIMSNEVCSKGLGLIYESNVCAGGLEDEDPCQGNFGSPLVVEKSGQDVVVGLVVWRYDCNFAGIPVAFARVSVAREWIESTTKNVCFA